MTTASAQIKRGLFWVGSATLVMRLIDLGAILIVLRVLDEKEVGLASLAWSVGVVLEALSGLGISVAVVQAKEISRQELDSLFWCTLLIAVGLAGSAWLAAPWIAHFYGEAALTPMIGVSSLKLIFVGAAVVPLQLLARDLQFRESAAVQTLATLLEGITKIALVFTGLGAWALVISNVLRGAYLCLALWLMSSFRPHLHFVFQETKYFLLFGMRAATASVLAQSYRNIDFFLVGKFLGLEALGIYRVAFDVAMVPVEAIMQMVNRVIYPVFAKIADNRDELFETYLKASRYLWTLMGPMSLILYFFAEDLIVLATGPRWLEAAPAVQILCFAAILRASVQQLTNIYHSVGKPQYAIVDAAVTFVVLASSMLVALYVWGKTWGTLSVCVAWIVSYVVLFVILSRWTQRLFPFSFLRYLCNLGSVLISLGCMALAIVGVRYFFLDTSGRVHAIGVGLSIAVGLGFYAALLRYGMHMSWAELRLRR